MPAIWRACLAGKGKVDLRGCRVLSEDFFLWSGADLQSRLGSFLASKLLRGHVRRLAPADYPAPLQSPEFHGQVYRLADLVLDVPSLVQTLAQRQQDAIFTIDWQRCALQCEGRRAALALADCTLVPQQWLLTAGAGNAALVAQLRMGGVMLLPFDDGRNQVMLKITRTQDGLVSETLERVAFVPLLPGLE